MLVSAYIPCFNNAQTVARAITSLQKQTRPVDELIVIDDGSTDSSQSIVDALNIRLIHHSQNMGRGAARARAMQELQHELVLCCDATNILAPDFVERALPWFEDSKVSGVFGRISQHQSQDVIGRWRGRHLFRINSRDDTDSATKVNLFATFGALVRRSAVLSVGNYDPALRHSEDQELGERLLRSGFELIYDPSLGVVSTRRDSLSQVLERYWRWNAGAGETVDWHNYLRQISYSLKVMVIQDLKAGDPFAVPISITAPHYQFWRSLFRKKTKLMQQSRD